MSERLTPAWGKAPPNQLGHQLTVFISIYTNMYPQTTVNDVLQAAEHIRYWFTEYLLEQANKDEPQ